MCSIMSVILFSLYLLDFIHEMSFPVHYFWINLYCHINKFALIVIKQKFYSFC